MKTRSAHCSRSSLLQYAGCALSVTLAAGCANPPATQGGMGSNASPSSMTQLATAASPGDSAAGAYLTIVGGCNDCHTMQWAETDGKVPDAQRLTGSPVGYRGPWGTTYAANLRMVVSRIPEDRWVQILTTADGGDGRPPMPWMNTRQMTDHDLRAMYRYIHALGAAGERTPRGLAPNVEPTTAYIWFVPRQPGSTSP